ncbi:hypothetical protein OS493_022712 [Desmophyllum pertusum]|uniref:Uncharacterized protein n=1 Tax=Desmophyllum pertusum TaxID=174260 RepID=A0A9W9YAI8_9CNID|nr:hypothetical protein OS493_022712 [Desmophyllum pertusum]
MFVDLEVYYHATVHTGIFEVFDIEKQRNKIGLLKISRMGNPINYRILCKTIFCTVLKELEFFFLFEALHKIKQIIYKYLRTENTMKIDKYPTCHETYIPQ